MSAVLPTGSTTPTTTPGCAGSTRRLTSARRATPALRTGTESLLDAGPGPLAWLREGGDGARRLAVVNVGPGAAPLAIPAGMPTRGTIMVGSDPARPGAGTPSDAAVDLSTLTLAAGEALLIRLEATA